MNIDERMISFIDSLDVGNPPYLNELEEYALATDVPITFSGGTEDGRIGTSFQQIKETVDNNAADTLLGFFDFGSSKMNLEMVSELSEKNILMCKVPLVEGAYTAASLLQAGVPFEAVIEQLREMDIDK